MKESMFHDFTKHVAVKLEITWPCNMKLETDNNGALFMLDIYNPFLRVIRFPCQSSPALPSNSSISLSANSKSESFTITLTGLKPPGETCQGAI